MSHIIEVYAKEMGVKIGKPYITEHFYPLKAEKYITIHNSNKMPTKDYDYWDLVLFLVKKGLSEHDIKVIQVGGKEDKQISGVDFYEMGNSYKNMNYIIKNSMLHVGVDSLPVHVASAYDKPVIVLYGNTFKETCKPLWNKKNKAVYLEPDFSEKLPSFSTVENTKRINEIKPELVAQSIFNQLGIDNTIEFKTVRAGRNFHHSLVEIVPNFFGTSSELKDKVISLRADIHFDEENIFQWSRHSILNLYLKQPISDQLLGAIKKRTPKVIFEIESLDEDYSAFLKKMQRNKMNVKLFTKNEDILSEARLRYFDFDLFFFQKPEAGLPDRPLKYISKKMFITDGETYKSKFSHKRLDKSSNFTLNEDSLEELESFYIYE